MKAHGNWVREGLLVLLQIVTQNSGQGLKVMGVDERGKRKVSGACGPAVTFQRTTVFCEALMSHPIPSHQTCTAPPTHLSPSFSFILHRKPVSPGEVDMHELRLGRITVELTQGKMILAVERRLRKCVLEL